MGLHNQSAFKRVLMLTGSSATTASSLLNAYGGQGFAMLFSGTEPSISIKDDTTPSNNWESADGPANSVQNFFKNRSFTSYTGPVSTGKRLMQADGYIKPCRHNLLALSEVYPDPGVTIKWANPSDAVTRGQADPFGTTKASKFALGTGAVLHRIYQAAIVTTSTPVTCSYYAKANGYNYVYIREESSTGAGAVFDLSGSGSVVGTYDAGSVSISNATITAVSGYAGWFRVSCVMSFSSATTIGFGMGFPSQSWTSGDPLTAWAGDTVSGAYFAFPMVNSGTQPLEYVSSEAHNRVLQSANVATSWTNANTTDASNSTTAPDGTTTADSVIDDATASARHIVFQTQTGMLAVPTTFSTYVKAGTRGFAFVALQDASSKLYGVTVNLSTGAAGDTRSSGSPVNPSYAITSVGNGWHRVSVTFTPTAGTGYIIIGGADSATPASYDINCPAYNGDGSSLFYIWGMQMELASSPGKYVATTTAAVYNPHFDIPIEYNTDGTVKALRREEERTNLLLRSNELDNASWSRLTIPALTANAVASQSGATDAEKLTSGIGSASHLCYQAVTVVSDSVYALSFYVKKGTHRYVVVDHQRSTNNYATAIFDLDGGGSTATQTSVGVTSGTISSTSQTSVGNGWYRLAIVAAATGTTLTASIGFATAAIGNTITSQGQVTFTGTGAETFYAWGAQAELGSTVSSLIVTGSATVTRAADVIECSNRVFGWADATLTAYTKATLQSIAATQRLIAIDDGTANETHQLSIVASTGVYNSTTVDGGVTQANASTGNAVTAGTAFKAATSIKVNDLAAGLNNGTLATDTSITMPTVHTIRFGAGLSAAAPSTGEFHEFLFVPTDLSDAQLGSLTTL